MADVTYYFNKDVYPGGSLCTDYWGGGAPQGYMKDGLLETFGSTSSDGCIHKLTATTCPGDDLGTILAVMARVYGYGDGDDRILLNGNSVVMQSVPAWSGYLPIFTPPPTWADLPTLECTVQFSKAAKGNTMRCAKVEVRVTYTPSGGYPFRRHTLKGGGPYSGRRGYDEATGHRRGFWP